MARITFEMERDPLPRNKRINGVEFRIATPPFLLPDHMEPIVDDPKGTLRIRFIYLGDSEPSEVLSTHGPVTIVVGKRTRKLLAIEVHVEQFDVDRIRILISDEVAPALLEAPQADEFVASNYESASKALRNHAADLAQFAVQ
jgi:hypothetical protein